MKLILASWILACLMISCHSGRHFTTRKYMSGRYVSEPTHLHSTKALDIKESRQGAIAAFHAKTDLQSISQQDVYEMAEKNKTQQDIRVNRKQESRRFYFVGKNKMRADGNWFVQKPVKAAPSIKIKPQKAHPWPEKKPISSEAIASVILSGFGLVIYVGILFSLGFFPFTYLYVPIMVIGLISLILGVIFGILAIKKYNREIRNGEYARTTNKVLGILGFSMGLAGIAGILLASTILVFISILSY